jgi:nucleotide-binding universal stress UspA family protein
MFADACIFRSGRPVVLVPRGHASAFSLDRVIIAWDGGLHATRAVAGAMPLLTAAKEVQVVTVAEKAKEIPAKGADLVRNLKRHGINAALLALPDETDIAGALLGSVKSTNASLLVMGAFGHYRVLEFMLGGVTRRMLTEMPVPVLMAH